MNAGSRAFFLDADRGGAPARGQRLCVFHPAQGGPAKAQMLLLPPFAEEMNKSRRMLALSARAFARAGIDVLMMDLLGCGDSSGDFGDARWTDWQDDVRLGAEWLAQQAHRADLPLWLWGVRAGALLAPAVLESAASQPLRPHRLLLWQPVVTGKLQLQQFLRLRVAADLIGGQAKGAVQQLRDALAQGDAVEIAGYTLGAALAHGLEQAQLKPQGGVDRMVWLEVSARPDAALTPAAASAVQAWQAQGTAVTSGVVQGPSFWAATEIEEAPALIEASLAAIAQPAPVAADAFVA